jgi:hypothetical protein
VDVADVLVEVQGGFFDPLPEFPGGQGRTDRHLVVGVSMALSSCWVSRAMSRVGAGRQAASRPRSGSRGQANDLVPGGEAGGHFVSVVIRGEAVAAGPKVR